MLKRKRAEDRADVGSFPTIIIYRSTQSLIGDNDLNNHDNTVLAMLLESCKHMKTRNNGWKGIGGLCASGLSEDHQTL